MIKFMKLPLQIQLFVTAKCNRSCDWCIEKENLNIYKDMKDYQYSEIISNLLKILNIILFPIMLL